MMTPCPSCGSVEIKALVHLHATQYLHLSPRASGGYEYHVIDENIAEKEVDIITLTCCTCLQEWEPGEER